MLDPDSFLEVKFLSSRVTALRVSPLTSMLLIFPSAAIVIILLTGTSEESLKGSPKTVKNIARTATPIKRYMNILRMERGFITKPT